MRIIIYTGKGGVGKTSVAAASACKIAQSGKRVLVMSTDQAHSLGDSFDKKIGKEPVPITDNLFAMEIDSVFETEKSWGNLKNYLKEMLTIQGTEGIEVEELLVFPGMEELFSMFKILEIYESGEYDVLIVDCAPTGETLSLLKYPEKLSGFIETILPIKRKGAEVAGPLVEKLTKIPMPDGTVFDDIEYVMNKMERLRALLLDKECVSLRIVTTPEKIVLREAKRSFTYLYLYNYNVDAIIVNRIYSTQAMQGYFSKWEKIQEETLVEIRESFSKVPKFYLELQKEEVRTLPMLQIVADILFGQTDISQVLFQDKIYSLYPEADNMVMQILLPFADKEEMELKQVNHELILELKYETRRFLIPASIRDREIKSAKLEEGYLKIKFL